MPTNRLPIYQGYQPTEASVELVGGLDRDVYPAAGSGGRGRACDRCKLGERKGLRSPCLGAEGQPGGLLIIGEAPGMDEDSVGRPFVGKSGRLLREKVQLHWKGPVAYDNALRCFPMRGLKLVPKMIDQCRPFLAQTIEEVKPSRIIAVGAWASQALFGRNVSPFGSRAAYSYLRNGDGAPIPVFFVLHPAAALRNRFVRQWFDRDMERALTAPNPPHGPWNAEVTVVSTERLALHVEKLMAKQEWFSFDVETSGKMWNPDFEIISVALCGSDREDDDAWVWDAAALADPAIRAPLLRMLRNPRVKKMGQNVKYDQLAFRAVYGITVRPIVMDTRLQRKLLEPEAEGALGKMAELVGMGGLKEEAQDGMGAIVKAVKAALRKKTPDAINAAFEKLGIPTAIESAVRLGVPVENFMYALLPYETLTRYNARDSVATKRLGILMNEQLRLEPNLFRVWKDQVLPAAVALERIEGWGVATSKVAIRTFDHFLESRERTLKLTLDAYGADINWDSRDQVAELLFKKLRLPTLKMTATGKASTDAETLEFVAEKSGHPLPKALLDYRFVTKLRGTYSQGLYDHIKADGRIHPNIKLDGARSGRTSCTDPNLQNIPRADSPEGKMARDCFVAPPDHYLVETDYSQLELRVAAMLSGDKVMQEIFSSGIDYHLRTAQMVSRVAWGIAPEQVTDKHRSLAKSVNFGVLYGKTARTLAKEWGVAQHKAEAIVNAIMGNFKQLQKWTARQQAEASKTGEIWTWWKGHKARRRPMWQIADQDDARASVARNGAVNTPIQGTASDFCIASLTAAVAWIEDDGLEDLVKLILAVHDSLMFEVHSSMVNETISTTHDIMTSHESMGVPLVADFKVGRSWGSMVKIKPGQDFRKVLADAEAAAGAR